MPDAPIPHDVFCNIGRYICERCGLWRSWCFTHRKATMNNRCLCHA